MTVYKKIAVAIDFSEQSIKAFRRAIEMAKDFNAKLLIAHVVDTSFGSIAAYDLKFAEEMKVEAKEKLKQYKKIAEDDGVADVEIYVEEGVAKSILSSLADIDLMICGATGYSKIEKLLIGSVAERIVRHSKYDVLVVR
jgi:nucleotide-binding universal stress UspA family protein